MKRIVAILALLFWLQPAQAGELAQGLSAYRAGNYTTAIALLKKEVSEAPLTFNNFRD